MREKKVRDIRKVEGKILELQDTIKREAARFKNDVEKERSLRVKRLNDQAHHKTLDLDSKHRISDRAFEIRSYSKMDLAVWQYPQVRDWFNSYAPTGGQEQKSVRYIDTGYTIEVDK